MVVAASSGLPVFKNIEPMAVHGVPHLFGRNRQVMRPFTLVITAGDFAFAARSPLSPSASSPPH
jgi:hypothetical protein